MKKLIEKQTSVNDYMYEKLFILFIDNYKGIWTMGLELCTSNIQYTGSKCGCAFGCGKFW